VENGICSLGLDGKCLDSFVRGQNQQIDFSAARLEFHLVHHRKRSISSRADYEALALPGYLFLDRDRGTSELFAEFFRGLLLALANPAAVKELSRYLSFLAILLHGGFFSFSSRRFDRARVAPTSISTAFSLAARLRRRSYGTPRVL
jgi:hypothetical protein